MTIRGPIPEHIRRLMPQEERADMGKVVMTTGDAQEKIDGRREKELQENIAALLRQRDIWFDWKRMDKRSTATLGCPDFLFCVDGKACAFEVKLPAGVISGDQMRCHIAMLKNGWFVRVVRSETEALEQLEVISRG